MRQFEKVGKGFLIAVTILILYIPIFVILLLSVNESRTGFSFNGFSLKWYVELLSAKPSIAAVRYQREAIVNTLEIAFYSTVISTVVGTFVAIGVNAFKQKTRRKILLLNNVPIVNADIVTGLSLLVIFSLIGMQMGMLTMLIAHIFFSIPFVILSVLPKLREMDNDLYNAALDLGCTPFGAVMKVIIPTIKTGIITGALIAFTMSIDDFIISYYTTGQGFNNFSTWLYGNLKNRGFTPSVYAYNSLITIITLIILVIVNFSNKKGTKRNEKNI